MATFNRNYIVSQRQDRTFGSAADRMCHDFGTMLTAIESSKSLQAKYLTATYGQRMATIIRFLAMLFGIAEIRKITIRKGQYRYNASRHAEFHDLPKEIVEWISTGTWEYTWEEEEGTWEDEQKIYDTMVGRFMAAAAAHNRIEAQAAYQDLFESFPFDCHLQESILRSFDELTPENFQMFTVAN